MLNAYANQDLTRQTASTTNEYNEPTRVTTTIKGRKETGFKQVRNAQGAIVVSTAVIFTQTAIQQGDLIDGSRVIAVNAAVDLRGAVRFYEAYLE
jgi:hypothetical protein